MYVIIFINAMTNRNVVAIVTAPLYSTMCLCY